jgi:hypothetical protein
MSECGICCINYIINRCELCRVNFCIQCDYSITGILYICKLCFMICHGEIYYQRYFYCKCCDRLLQMNPGYTRTRCKFCINSNKTITNRLLFSHYKAKNIINLYYIRDIAKLIFDYYYQPRRYFEGEF